MDEIAFEEDRSEYMASKNTDIVKRCPTLMDRIARNGMEELDPRKLMQHVDLRHEQKTPRGYQADLGATPWRDSSFVRPL